jgi:chemotaxis protein MotB
VIPKRKRVVHQRESIEESGYMAAASDLMIGVLFIFIILVAYLSFQISKTKSDTDEKINYALLNEKLTIEKKNLVDELNELKLNQKKNEEMRQKSTAATVRIIGKKLQDTNINVVIDEKSGVITFPADILFDTGEFTLSPEGKRIIYESITVLEGLLPCYVSHTGVTKDEDQCKTDNPTMSTIETIFIEGHTDSAPISKPNYDNWHLGLDRARTVYQLFVDSNMGSYRNDREQPVFGVSSYADGRPARGSTKSDYSKNRRVEMKVVVSHQGKG